MASFAQLDKVIKSIFDRIGNDTLKNTILQTIPIWTASLLAGVVAVFYARLFALTEKLTTTIFHYNSWLLFIVSPVCFIVSWWLVKKYAPYARGSGIPQVMAAVEQATPRSSNNVKYLLSLRIILVKVMSSIIMVIGGGAIGREGPTIQITGSIFKKVNDILPAWWPKISQKNMIMTGAAAGLAAAFNTPLGGIVFAVEELTKMHISNFKSAIITAVIIAGLTAQSFLGSYLYLGYPSVTVLSKYILLYVILIAVVAGGMGSIMAKLIRHLLDWKDKFKLNTQHLVYLLFCSLTIAALGYLVSEDMLGSGKSIVTRMLFTDDRYCEWYTPLLRIIGPVLSFTTGASGGIFAPGLSAGGSLGSLLSSWLHLSQSDTNLMILAGMVAFLTGITHAPFTSAILVLEMTDRNNLILHLMLAGIVSSFVALIVDKHSIYYYLKLKFIQELEKEGEDKAGHLLNPGEKTDVVS